MKTDMKVYMAILIFLTCISTGYILNSLHKRSFYTLEELIHIESDDSIQQKETMIPFQPREYIRKITIQQ